MCIGPHEYIPVSNTCKVEMIYLQDEQYVVNVFHVKQGSGWTTEEQAGVADNMKAWFDTNWNLLYPDEYSLRTIRVTNLNSQNAPVVERAYVPPAFGENDADDPMPNNVTVAIKWITGLRGRSYRGRTYLPCLMSTLVAGNRLTAYAVTTYGASMALLKSKLELNGRQMVVVSYCQDKQWLSQGVATPIVGYGINEVIDSQRRRLPERGR